MKLPLLGAILLSSIFLLVDADGQESSGEVSELSGHGSGVEGSGFAEENMDPTQLAIESEKQFLTSRERDNEKINNADESVSFTQSGHVKNITSAGENQPSAELVRTIENNISTPNATGSPSSSKATIIPLSTTERVITTTPSWIVVPEAVTVKSMKPKTEKPVSVVCNKMTVCYKDVECGRGRCMGAFVGKCNCNACVNFRACDSDVQCGGLEGACNLEIKKCKCADVYAKHGMKLYIDVLTQFCNNKPCEGRQDCYGQPCNPGRCYC